LVRSHIFSLSSKSLVERICCFFNDKQFIILPIIVVYVKNFIKLQSYCEDVQKPFRVLRGLKMFARSRPAKFKPSPPRTRRLLIHVCSTRTVSDQHLHLPLRAGKPQTRIQRASSLVAICSVVHFKTNRSPNKTL